MTPRIVGLDLSLTRTGICVDGTCHLITSRHKGMARIHDIATEILHAAEGVDLILIEGYSYASTHAAHQLGELGGVIRYQLWDRYITYVDVAPSTLKKAATGKGNTNKDTMVANAARLGCPADDNNAVDAWSLYQFGLYALGYDSAYPVTTYREAARNSIVWPALEGAA